MNTKKSLQMAMNEARELSGQHPKIEYRVMDCKGKKAVVTGSEWIYRERVLAGYWTVCKFKNGRKIGGAALMKKSEMIQKEIDVLEMEYEERAKAEVDATSGEYDVLWSRFWESYGCKNRADVDRLKFELYKELNREIEVGDGVTMRLWSDRHSYTVIAKTKCTLTIQRDKATIDSSFKPEWITGGFSAICLNSDEQKWLIERDPNGGIQKCHWSEKRGRWQTGPDGSIGVYPGRREFYDFNF